MIRQITAGAAQALISVAASLMILALPAFAEIDLPEPVAKWFTGLKAADQAAIEAVLSPEATIELRDIGVTQTGVEFIGSFEEWKYANEGAEILVAPESADAGSATVKVCYRFPSNELAMRESYRFSDGMITASVQEQIAENCSGF